MKRQFVSAVAGVLSNCAWGAQIIAAMLVVAAVNHSPGVLASDPWRCTPIDPSLGHLPEQPCFRAQPHGQNQVILEWRVRNSASTVYVYDIQGPDYRDPGVFPAECSNPTERTCSNSIFVDGGGTHRWSLRVLSPQGGALYVPAEATIRWPRQPRIRSVQTSVDFLTPGKRRLRWHTDGRNGWDALDVDRAWVEVSLPGQLGFQARRYPRNGPGAELDIPAEAFDRVGQVTYLVRDCAVPEPTGGRICSRPAPLTFDVAVDHFLGDSVIQVGPGEPLQLSFTTNSGNLWMLVSETLLPARQGLHAVTTRSGNYRIPAGALSPGVHKVALISCVTPGLRCANRADAAAARFDGQVEILREAYVNRGDPLARVHPSGGGEPQVIHAPADGMAHYQGLHSGGRIVQGALVAFVITSASDQVYVVVDGPVDWERERDYRLDFEEGVGVALEGSGQALDTVFDATGGIWQTLEFSNAIQYVDATGRARSLELPLGRQVGLKHGRHEVSRPFALWSASPAALAARVSALSERVSLVGHHIWFTQGGGLQPGNSQTATNRSRVISVNTAAVDSPQTLFDDRLCAYTLPADDPAGFGNNQVLGLTAAGGRIWLAESRGLLSDGGSVISAFMPGPGDCSNTSEMVDPGELPGQPLQYCAPGQSPEQDGCLWRIPVHAGSEPVKVAHLETDPGDDSVWFTDARRRFLGHVDMRREKPVRLYRLPDEHREPADGMPLFGGFPWALRVDADAVYVGEYATRHLLRFDKATASFDEIPVPARTTQARLHSLDLDAARRRLWFTLADERHSPGDSAVSTIGYIDLDTWHNRVRSPVAGQRIDGVIYAGLHTIPAPPGQPPTHQAFRGIAVDPASGRLAMGTMWREQVTVLTPRSTFWP